ncbi:MAG: IS110 family transposase, partial [Cardiobacteriaceae bacterium]|nr:IS110 family transposase [Cardiobacteriaceae bacterium]
TSVAGQSRISKVGNAFMRSSLYMPALVAYRSEVFQPFVNRLIKNGKRPKQVIVAIMRKLAVIAFTLYRTGKKFDKTLYK